MLTRVTCSRLHHSPNCAVYVDDLQNITVGRVAVSAVFASKKKLVPAPSLIICACYAVRLAFEGAHCLP